MSGSVYRAPTARGPLFYILTGVGVGCAGLLFVAVVAALLFPITAGLRQRARTTMCLSQLKTQGMAITMYRQDYDERMPPAKLWMDSTLPYMKREAEFRCPAIRATVPDGYGYAYNTGLTQELSKEIRHPETTMQTYDSANVARNAADAGTSFPAPGRHTARGGHGNNVGYVDGHAKLVLDRNSRQ